MVGDVNELVVEQARVDGVEHPAHPDRAIPGGEVRGMVHRQRRDPVAGLDANRFQRLCHAPGVLCHLGPVGAGDRSVAPRGDDLAATMLTLGMVDQPHHPERPILHCA